MTMDKSAIEAIAQSAAFRAANSEMPDGVFAHPSDWQATDLEQFQSVRRRQRGKFRSDQIAAWAEFVRQNATADNTPACFITPTGRIATAVLNFGSDDLPGHCDFTATLEPRQTPAWAAVTAALDKALSQQDATLLLEDWLSHVTFHAAIPEDGDEGSIIPPGKALRALKKITVKASSDTTAETSHYRAQKSTLETIEASSSELDSLPAKIVFTAAPCDDLDQQSITIRAAITRTDDNAVKIKFTPVNMGLVEKAIALDFAQKARQALTDTAVIVHVGTYSPT